jgi:hypothetical protein
MTRTADELSIVCASASVPDDVRAERGWRAFRIAGSIPFSTVGVIRSLTAPLADAGIGVFVISTFDTDYLLVGTDSFTRACIELGKAGYTIDGSGENPS